MKNLKNLPENIKTLKLFAENESFAFKDKNAADITAIIETNPHLLSFNINLSQMTDVVKNQIQLPQDTE